MAIVNNREVKAEERGPGLYRKMIVTKENGATLSSGGDLTIKPGGEIRLHTHDVEEIIFIHSGQLKGTLGDEVRTLGPDQTLIAPAGVVHGLLNTGKSDARIITFFPVPAPKSTFK
jgi:quercetin dioxygenase-like cupin family protein